VTPHTLGNGRASAASSLSMHAYQHFATLVMLDSYPSCQRPTEIVDDRSPRSTRSPVSHRKVRCLRGHLFTMLVD
jgi:hypothetical protein